MTYNLDIPARSSKDALQALVLVSYYRLLYSTELVDGKRSPALNGEFTAEQAVKTLLSGTDWSHQVTSDGLVRIHSSPTPLPVLAIHLPAAQPFSPELPDSRRGIASRQERSPSVSPSQTARS